MRAKSVALLICVGAFLSACADFYTVARRTTLPATPAKSGTAIHLDAQQRLFIYGPDGRFCAEASPDAMAAYAAALALGVSAPGYGAGSAANASQSSVASIGLRTQSITLMRDSLYRLCEATANDTISNLSATQLLARSQDLTAVVVAVEQLTGAVAANQAILTSSSNAEASASLIADAQLADTARKNVEQKNKELLAAQDAQKEQDKKVGDQRGRLKAAQDQYNKEATKSPPPDNLTALKDQVDAEDRALSTEQSKLDVANERVAAAEKSKSDAQQVLDTIESKNSAALTNAVAGTNSSGEFSEIVQRNQLSKESTEAIAGAVKEMVVKVLDKNYTTEACLTLITNPGAFNDLKPAQEEVLKATLGHCQQLVLTKIESEIGNIQVTTYEPDQNSYLLKKAVTDPVVKDRVLKWIQDRKLGVSLNKFVNDPAYAQFREQMIAELQLR